MESKQAVFQKRNRLSQERHRREVLGQIVLPLVIGVVLALALAVLSVIGSANTALWAQISAIWLIIPLIFLSVLVLIVLVAAIAAVTWLLGNLPYYFYRIHTLMMTVNRQVEKLDDQVAEPLLRLQSFKASLHQLKERLLGKT